MATVITVMNMKGGVGKTTVTANLGGVLAHYTFNNRSRKVLLIDYDPQFNLSQAYIPSKKYFDLEAQKKTSLTILQNDEAHIDPFSLQVSGNRQPPKVATLAHRLMTWGNGTFFDIIPSTLELMYVATAQPSARVDVIEERFAKFITECRSIYDVTLIDCHPAGSILTRTSLRNSDHVIIPVAPQQFAIRGIGLMLKFIDASKHASQRATPHILFNAMPRSFIADEEQRIRNDPTVAPYCLQHTLKKYKAFSELVEGQGLVWKSKKAYSTEAFRNLVNVANEIISKGIA